MVGNDSIILPIFYVEGPIFLPDIFFTLSHIYFIGVLVENFDIFCTWVMFHPVEESRACACGLLKADMLSPLISLPCWTLWSGARLAFRAYLHSSSHQGFDFLGSGCHLRPWLRVWQRTPKGQPPQRCLQWSIPNRDHGIVPIGLGKHWMGRITARLCLCLLQLVAGSWTSVWNNAHCRVSGGTSHVFLSANPGVEMVRISQH